MKITLVIILIRTLCLIHLLSVSTSIQSKCTLKKYHFKKSNYLVLLAKNILKFRKNSENFVLSEKKYNLKYSNSFVPVPIPFRYRS